jgi:glycosyltransferase involved in cell wall biosynthesis
MRFYRRALRLQTVSRVIADAMVEQAPGIAGKVCIIPNPLPPFIHPSGTVQRQRKKVLFVGRVHPEKGLDLLVDAAQIASAQDPELRFEVVGPWEEKFGGGGMTYFQTLLERAKSLGDKLSFAGPIFDQSTLHRKYLEAGLFVYPSLAAKGEASPVAPLEALAAGCPVLTTNLKCFEDLLGNGSYAHRFDHEAPGAAARFSDLILRTTRPDSGWEEQSRCAKLRAEDFRPELIAAEYLQQFSAALRAP